METTTDVRVRADIALREPGERFDLTLQKGYGNRAKLTALRVQRVTHERYTRGVGDGYAGVYWVSGAWHKVDGSVGEMRHRTTVERDVLPPKLADQLDALAARAARDFSDELAT